MLISRKLPADACPRRGIVAVLVAVLMPVVIGVMALTLDGGLLYLQRRQAQSVADAAALAGAYQLYNGSNFSVAQNAAIAIGAQNGVTISASQVTAPKTGYVAVSVTTSKPRLFSGLWGAGTLSVTASAVARGTANPYSKAAILVLNRSGSSVTLSGTTQVTAVNGSIIVDSTSAASILSSGTPSITAPVLDLSGNIRYSGHNPNNATVTNYSQPNTPDPLAGIPAPSSSGMTVQSSSAISLSGSSTRTLNPGVYIGGITMSGSSSVTLNPGVYYINGGGINMSGTTSITGNGVFIYNTGGGTINLSGTGTISLNPMTSGTYAGITIFQDRSNTAGATMSGGSNISNTGTFYFPSSTLTLSGNSGVAAMGSQIIVNNLTFSGTSGIDVVYGGSVASSSSLALVQ
ncbi:MAG TPA: pilus assembly protein TadG-related protein [Isosphaeraceae bacterium]|nr:pilus assembly protein TadG-related protein [Isosphaeraceae bacterium]